MMLLERFHQRAFLRVVLNIGNDELRLSICREKESGEKAIPLLTSLTREYKDDGDTWFMLGHGYLQTQQCQKAKPVLKQVLELGTIMTGIKSASSPSNDIMIKVAQCYSDLGNESQALEWINKALELRWDDRKSLIGG